MFTVRDATVVDAAACAALYAPYVRDTAVSFEAVPPEPAEMARRIESASRFHAWLVLVTGDGEIAGYAYGGPFAARPAYRWSCEVSVYLDGARLRRGGGRLLYAALLDRLGQRGYRTATAGLALPNDASAALHRAFGFEPVGTYRRIAWKHGAWRDVCWMQRDLGDGYRSDQQPPEPGCVA